MKNRFILSSLCVIFVLDSTKSKAQNMTEKLQPPVAKIIPKTLEKFADVRTDNYFWMNDRENPEVIDYLNAENVYYQKMTAHTKGFQKELFEEMKGRIKEDDESVPYLYNGYYYITRFETGKNYPIYSRKRKAFRLKKRLCLIAIKWQKDILIFNWEV